MGDAITFLRFIMSLRRERERLGLSLSDVAERAGIDKGALSRLENGQQLNPTVNTLTRYVRALGKSMAWMLDGNRNCPECRMAGGIIDGLNDQWGFCQSCGVKWRIVGNRFALSPGETDEHRRSNEKALAGYREVVSNPLRSDQPGG
jgi:transcriptional regulator with XRE-family HTH domain